MSDKLLACIEQDLQSGGSHNNKTSDDVSRELPSPPRLSSHAPSKKRKHTGFFTVHESEKPVGKEKESKETKETKETKEIKEIKDVSRTLRTKAEAIQQLQIAEAKLLYLTQDNEQLKIQLRGASNKISDLETQLDEYRIKFEKFLTEMVAKSETHNSMLMAQSVTITNRAVDVLLPSPSASFSSSSSSSSFKETEKQHEDLRRQLIAIQNECQSLIPAIPSLDDLQKKDVQERYKQQLNAYLSPFLHSTQTVRKSHVDHLTSVYQRNLQLFHVNIERITLLARHAQWQKEKRLTELSLYCLQWAMSLLVEKTTEPEITSMAKENEKVKEKENERRSNRFTNNTTLTLL